MLILIIFFKKNIVFLIYFEIKINLSPFVLHKVVYWKSISKLSYICLPLEKLDNEKHFLIKENLCFVFRKVFLFYFGWKTLSRSCKKFKNIILFTDYIKFCSQTFDCYIFCFELFFQFYPLKFNLIWFLY
jgi:hypothetical protein